MIATYWQYYRRQLVGEKGVGTLEIILIIFVLIGFVVLFRKAMFEMITDYLARMDPKIVQPGQ